MIKINKMHIIIAGMALIGLGKIHAKELSYYITKPIQKLLIYDDTKKLIWDSSNDDLVTSIINTFNWMLKEQNNLLTIDFDLYSMSLLGERSATILSISSAVASLIIQFQDNSKTEPIPCQPGDSIKLISTTKLNNLKSSTSNSITLTNQLIANLAIGQYQVDQIKIQNVTWPITLTLQPWITQNKATIWVNSTTQLITIPWDKIHNAPLYITINNGKTQARFQPNNTPQQPQNITITAS